MICVSVSSALVPCVPLFAEQGTSLFDIKGRQHVDLFCSEV